MAFLVQYPLTIAVNRSVQRFIALVFSVIFNIKKDHCDHNVAV